MNVAINTGKASVPLAHLGCAGETPVLPIDFINTILLVDSAGLKKIGMRTHPLYCNGKNGKTGLQNAWIENQVNTGRIHWLSEISERSFADLGMDIATAGGLWKCVPY